MSDEVNILAEEKPKTVTLVDGKEYILPPKDLTTLANIEKTMGIGGKAIATKLETEPLQTFRLLTYAVLKESYPQITCEQAGHLVGLKEIPLFSEIISALFAISS